MHTVLKKASPRMMSYRNGLYFVILVAVTGILRWHYLHEPLERDLTTFAYIGNQLLHGGQLYTQLYEFKPPGIFVLYMLGNLAFGYGQLSVFLLGLTFTVISLTFVYRILLNLTDSSEWALLGGVLWALASNSILLQANQPATELFINTFVLAALWAVVRFLDSERILYLWVAGTAFAFYSLVKQHAVFPVVLTGLYIMMLNIRKNGLRAGAARSGNLLSVLVLPSLLVWGMVFTYFYATGRFEDFYQPVFKYAVFYSGNIFTNLFGILAPSKLFPAVMKDVFALYIGMLVWIVLLVLRKNRSQENVYVVFFIAGMYMAIASTRQYHGHYYQLLIPFMVVTSTLLIRELYVRLGLANKKRALILSLSLIIALVARLGYFQNKYWHKPLAEISALKYGSQEFQVVKELGEKLKSSTSKGDLIYEWGDNPGIYFYSGRQSPSGVLLKMQLKGSLLFDDRIQKRTYQEVTAGKPLYFIGNFVNEDLSKNMFYPWLQNEYVYDGKFSFYDIYKRRDAVAGNLPRPHDIQAESSVCKGVDYTGQQ